jgi:hypothetical protein
MEHLKEPSHFVRAGLLPSGGHVTEKKILFSFLSLHILGLLIQQEVDLDSKQYNAH